MHEFAFLQRSFQQKVTGTVLWAVTEELPQALCATGRRSTLPVPKPETPDISLWNLLYRNIGKDLTKISMPVTLNEPLSMLQVTHSMPVALSELLSMLQVTHSLPVSVTLNEPLSILQVTHSMPVTLSELLSMLQVMHSIPVSVMLSEPLSMLQVTHSVNVMLIELLSMLQVTHSMSGMLSEPLSMCR